MKVFRRLLAVLCLTVGFTVVFSSSAMAVDDEDSQYADLAVGQPTMEEAFLQGTLEAFFERYFAHVAWSRFFGTGTWVVEQDDSSGEAIWWVAFSNMDGNVIFIIDRPFNEDQVEVINSTPVYERDRCWKHSPTDRYWVIETDNGWMDNPAAEELWDDSQSTLVTDWILEEVQNKLPFIRKTNIDQYLF